MYLVLCTTGVLLELFQTSYNNCDGLVFTICFIGFLLFYFYITCANLYPILCGPELYVVPRKTTAGNM